MGNASIADDADGQSPRIHAASARRGTIACQFRFIRMRIREENCNMVLLAAVTCVSVVVAGGASLLGSGESGPVRSADRVAGRVQPMSSPDKPVIYAGDQQAVRMIGAPFVPNTNPRER
jgi:hypothetical protein